jgi:hypothetical protein
MLTEFYGRPMYLGAHVLLPDYFDEYPEAHCPIMIYHGHFPDDFGGFSILPPTRRWILPITVNGMEFMVTINFKMQEAFNFHKQWTNKNFPRFFVIEIQLANPYYDDSYSVNSANFGPYGDAIMFELLPHIEMKFRGIGKGWARFTYGDQQEAGKPLPFKCFTWTNSMGALQCARIR